MFKIKLTVILFAMILLLTGCAAKDDFANRSAYSYPPVENISAKTQRTEYDGNVESINVLLTNNSDKEFQYDLWWQLEKEVDGEWKVIDFIVEEREFDCLIRSTRSSANIPCDLKGYVKQPLLPGHYRLWVGGEKGRVPAEFTIKE